MDNNAEALKTVGAAGVGAAVGAGAYGIMGGIGIVGSGIAAGVTLGPMMAIGASLFAAGYGVFWFGKQIGKGNRSEKR